MYESRIRALPPEELASEDMTPPKSPDNSDPKKQPRIETQIHRRRKAKAFSPLEAEWDVTQGTPPTQLRTVRTPQLKPESKKP
jgi:hypothetical protein